MKITQDVVVDSQTTLHIELDDDDLDPYLDRGYRRIAHQVSVPGFRKGKAPRSIVEGVVGRESILNEVLDAMVSETIYKAVEELELNAIGLPRVDNVEFDPVRFAAVVPLAPEIDLGDYRSIRIEYERPEINEDDVDERLNAIRESMGQWIEVDRPPQFNDLINIDMTSDVDDQSPWSAENDTFFIAEDGGYPIPGFSQQVVSAEPGEPVEFTLPIPEDHNDVSLAGKEASFTVTVNEVRERTMPELTDEWAQSLPDGFSSVQDVRDAIREAIVTATESDFETGYRNDAIQALVDGSNLLVAPAIVQNEAERIRQEQDYTLQQSNIQRSDYLAAMGVSEQDAEREAYQEAELRVRRNMIVTKLSEVEGVEVTDQDVDERFNQLYGGQRMRRQQRRALRQEVESSVKIEKTLDLLVSIARGELDADAQPEETQRRTRRTKRPRRINGRIARRAQRSVPRQFPEYRPKCFPNYCFEGGPRR